MFGLCLCFGKVNVEKEGKVLVVVFEGDDGDGFEGSGEGEIIYMDIEVGVCVIV